MLIEKMGSKEDQEKVQSVQNEMSIAESANQSATLVWSHLDAALILTVIRDQMVDAIDKRVVSFHLSRKLHHAFAQAEHSAKVIQSSLVNVKRPGIAVDIARLRDANALVIKNLGNCTFPPSRMNQRPPQS